MIQNEARSPNLAHFHFSDNSNRISPTKCDRKGYQSEFPFPAGQKPADPTWPRATKSPNDRSFNLKCIVGNRPSG